MSYKIHYDDQDCQNESPFEIYSEFIVINGINGLFCNMKWSANDSAIRGNLKGGVIMTGLMMINDGELKYSLAPKLQLWHISQYMEHTQECLAAN